MSMKNRAKKELQRQYVERLLDSDLSVAEWCKRNGVARQSLYGWLATFAETYGEFSISQKNLNFFRKPVDFFAQQVYIIIHR